QLGTLDDSLSARLLGMDAVALSELQFQRLERLVVRQEGDRSLLCEKTVACANARMIQKSRAHTDFADLELHLFQLANFDCARKIFPAHRKEGQFHLGGKNRGETVTRALVTENVDCVLSLVGREEKRQALDVVPVRMGQEQRQVNRRAAEVLVQGETELADA